MDPNDAEVVEVDISQLEAGDVLIHKRSDGRYALYGNEPVTGDRLLYRLADSLDHAKSAARNRADGARLWYSDWTAPDQVEKL
jgi:hypothetical protein